MQKENHENFNLFTIDKNVPVPLYYQLIKLIQDRIESGVWRPGDAIPTEHEFKEMYGLSQTTIRKAISELIHENVLEAKRPKGVFVCQPKVEECSNGFLTSFTEEFSKGGYVPRSRILRLEEIPVYGHIANELNLLPGSKAHFLYRLRYLNNEAISINTDYISSSLVPEFKQEDFTETGDTQSLYYILREKYGIQLVRAVETVSAISLSKDEAALLGTTSGTPVINRKRLVFDQNDKPILYEKTIIRYSYKTTLVGK